MMPAIEPVWTAVPGYESLYEISSEGVIRRPKGMKRTGNVTPGAELSLRTSSRYVQVSLCRDGQEKTHLVHRLVALAFVPSVNGKECVNHKNGIRHCNAASNLEWVTSKENYAHALQMGLAPTGDRNGSRTKVERRPRGESMPVSKLLTRDVIQIRELRKAGKTLSYIADLFSVCPQTIHNVAARKNWRHVA